ncbi:MAG: serine/threonine-protein kinase [Microbacterium enclense]
MGSVLPRLGDVFAGRYRVIQALRHDGEGDVYRVRDDLLARDVALKIFHLDPAAASAHPRRLAGARALTARDHPSLVTLYDAHLTPEGRGYLVMELIAGPSLRDHLDTTGPLTPAHAASLLQNIAEGLATIHDAGIVHQHVTSSNVLLRPLRNAPVPFRGVLAEFRISHLLGHAVQEHAARSPEDLDDYLPPEQVSGGKPQPASDVYALGLLAMEALTGERTLSGGAVQELLLTPLSYDPEVPTRFGYEWELLLTAMTDPDPHKRPTAAEVADLAAELRGGERLPAPVSVPAETPEAAEPIAALRAIDQSRETASGYRRRRAVWAWVTHYR